MFFQVVFRYPKKVDFVDILNNRRKFFTLLYCKEKTLNSSVLSYLS